MEKGQCHNAVTGQTLEFETMVGSKWIVSVYPNSREQVEGDEPESTLYGIFSIIGGKFSYELADILVDAAIKARADAEAADADAEGTVISAEVDSEICSAMDGELAELRCCTHVPRISQ
jgi:hypothetical protein